MMDYEAERLEAEDVADLRAQVAALMANGVSTHKAAAAERAAIVAWLRDIQDCKGAGVETLLRDRLMVDLGDLATEIEAGTHHGGGA